MIMLGFFAAMIVTRKRGQEVGMDHVVIVDVGIVVLLVGIVGARLLAVLADGFLTDFIHLCTDPTLVDPVDTAVRFCGDNSDCGFDYLCNLDAREAVTAGQQRSMCYPPRDCLAALKFWQGGLTFYGGVLLALPVGIWFAKRKGLEPLITADVFAPGLMLGLAFGRIGCFLNGCCYGAATKGVLGVHMPGLAGARHAVQIYESFGALMLYFVLRYLVAPRARAPGELFGWLLSSYGILRIALEFFRDDPRGTLGPLSTSQAISIPLIVTGVMWIAWTRKRSQP